MDETAVTPGAPATLAGAADGSAIVQPRPGERRVVEVSGQAELNFAFGFGEVSIGVVDVDVVLTFPDGGQIVLPALVLAALGDEPPRLRFANQLKDGHDLITAAGEVRLVETLPELTVSDNARARTTLPARQTPDTGAPEQPPQPTQQVVQLTSNDRYTATSVPFSSTVAEEAVQRPDPLLTGTARQSRSREIEDPTASGSKGEGALTERSDRNSSQQGNVTLQPNRAPALTSAARFDLGENQGEVGRLTGTDADGDQLTFAIIGGRDSSRFALNGASGSLFFVSPPDFEQPGATDGSNSYEIEVQISDGRDAVRQSLRIVVSDTNEAPSGATLSGGRVAEHTAGASLVGVVRGADPDTGANLTYAFASGGDAGGRFRIDAATGEITVGRSDLLDYESAQTQLVVVRVTDQAGLSVDTPLLIAIDDANDAPIITSNGGGVLAAVTLPENVFDVTTVAAFDEDAGSVVTYAIVAGDDAGLFSIDASTGELTLVSAFDFEAPADADGDNIYRVVVEASDGQGGADRQELAVTVVNRNDAPSGLDIDTTEVVENAAAGTLIGRLTGTDPDINAVLRYGFAPNGNGSGLFAINAVTGELTVAASNTLDFEGLPSHLIVVRVTDQFGLSLDRAFTIRLTDVDEAPVLTSYGGAANVELLVGEGANVAATVTAFDPERLPLTYTITGGSDAAAFVIDSANGTLRFLAPPNFELPTDADGDNRYSVSVTVSDGRFQVVQTVNVRVTDVGEAPVIVSGGGGDTADLTMLEGGTAAGVIAAVDPDAGSVLSYRIVGGADAARFVIDAVSGALRFATPADFDAPADANLDNVYVVVVEVSDGALVDRQTVRVAVLNVNDPPVITSDGGGATAAVSALENQIAVTTVTASDPDAGAILLFTISGGADAARFTIDAVTGALRFLAAPDREAPADANADNIYEVQVSVLDGVGGVDTQTLAVTVGNQNEAPVITSFGGAPAAGMTVIENATAVVTITATDVDAGAALSYSIIGGPDAARFTINAVTGEIRFVAAPNFEAPADAGGDNTYDILVQVSDGLGGVDVLSLGVSVLNLNESPEITFAGGGASVSLVHAENGGAIATLTAVDEDAGNTLTWTVIGGADAARFILNPTTGALSFITPPNFEAPTDDNGDGVYVVMVRVADGLGGSDTQELRISVGDVNDAPVITSFAGAATAALSLTENGTAVTTITASDVDAGATLTFGIAGGADAARFTIDPVTGVLRFVAPPDFENPGDAGGNNIYDVIVQVSDGQGGFDTQSLAVTVTNLNEAPVIVSPGIGPAVTIDKAENSGLAVTIVTAADPDAGASLTYAIVGGADASRFTINAATGALALTVNPNFEMPVDGDGQNTYDVVVQVSDGLGGITAQAITVRITDVNEAPVITSNGGAASIGLIMAENSVIVTDVDAADVDAATTLTYAIVGGADAGRFTIDAVTGVLRFAGGSDFEARADANGDNVYEVIIGASDGGLADTQLVTVTLTDLNDTAPDITSNGGALTAAIAIDEGETLVTTVVTVDPDTVGARTLAIVGGADAARFVLDAVTGQLRFVSPPDRENPNDQNLDNHYEVIIEVSDGVQTDRQTITVEVRNLNDNAPDITSDGGGASASLVRQENTTLVTTVAATDADAGATLTYSIVGGADAAAFVIDPATGELRFVAAPDFESAADSDGNNIYSVVVEVSDGSLTTTQSIQVTIADVNDVAPTILTPAALTVGENTAVVAMLTASDPDTVGTNPASFSIVGGADAGRFEIVAGALRFRAGNVPNFELPADVGADGVYEVTVQASDGVNTTTRAISVTVQDVNEAPTAVSLSNVIPVILENSPIGGGVKVADIAVTDDALGSRNLGLSGADAASFEIRGTELFYIGASPDRETKASYAVTITVDDPMVGATPDASAGFVLTIGNVNEAPTGITLGGPLTLFENLMGVAIGPITVTDLDVGETHTFVVSDARFDVLGGQLRLRPGQSVDRETEASITLDITATDLGGLSVTRTFTISITDADEFDISAIIDVDPAPESVAENVAPGTVVGIIANATDADATNNAVTYVFAPGGNPGGLFHINAATGVVTTTGPIDREAAASHTITVRAISQDSSFTTRSFTIAVTDVNEFSLTPIADVNAAADLVAENAAVGTAVGVTLRATDADATNSAVSYEFMPGGNPGGLFAIDAVTGVITLAAALDREAAASHTVVVRATSQDGSFRIHGVTIAVGDVNEFAVSAIVDLDGAPETISEAAAIGDAVGVTARASDADATTNGVTYGFAPGGNPGGLFAINAVTGVVTLAAALDREAAASHTITVRATSQDGSTSTQSFTITVTDVNEFAIGPITDTNAAANLVAEDAAIGAVVGVTLRATDADATTNGVTYDFAPGGNPGGLFAIDAVTGVVTLAGALDREAAGSHTITVRATSQDGSSSTQGFTITVGDVDEFDIGPIADLDGAAETVLENAAVGAAVGITARASDADATTNGVTYDFAPGGNPGGLFAIDAVTGVVTLAGALNREAAASHTITVRATSQDGSSSTQSFTIAVGDVNDNAPAFTSAGSATIDENTTTVMTLATTDADTTGTNPATLTITGGADGALFEIVAGALQFRAAQDAESPADANADGIYVVEVSAFDGVNTTVQTISVKVNDVDEFDVSAIADLDGAAETISEDAAIGAVVGITARASDADVGTNGVTYGFAPGGNPGGLFAINAVTGVVTLAAALDRETAASHTITVRATSQDGSTSTQGFTITVGDVNDTAPVITSPAATSIAENGTVVMLLTSTDMDTTGTNPAVFSISGGVDQSLFTIVGNELRFVAPPDFEAPADADLNNIYRVEVAASDGVNTAVRTIDVTVSDVVQSFNGSAGADSVTSTGEQLIATGLEGNDTLVGGALDDDLAGDDGADSLVGGLGDDILSGGADADTLLGGDGADLLFGGLGADSIDGGDGGDFIDVDAGDTASGGAGNDEFIIDTSALLLPGLSVQGGAGTDTAELLGAGSVGRAELVAALTGVEGIDFRAAGVAADLTNFQASDATALLGASGPGLNLELGLDGNDSFSVLDPAGDGFSHIQAGSVYTFYNSETVQDVTTEIARVTIV